MRYIDMAAMLLMALGVAPCFVVGQPSSVINVDWSASVRALRTSTGFQTVVNPVTSRESPYHDQVYEKIASLGSSYQRYVPWLPYPKMGIAELERPSHGGLCGFVNSGGNASNTSIWSTTLDCGKYGAGVIDSVVFADYGMPTGYCNELKAGACTKDVTAVVREACVGKASCTLVSSDAVFGISPCLGNRLAVEVTCSNKAVDTFTSWDFDLLDEGMLDFLAAADAANRTSIPNFSTIPNWLFNNSDRTYFPDDPLGETWHYEAGTALVDPTGTAVGDYYGRLLAHYLEGGFTDEGGRWIPGHNLTFSHWEVLNEVNYEHSMTPEFYTNLYDAIVLGIKRHCPRGAANLKFFGLGGAGESYVLYFLNKSHHTDPSIPIDLISVHSYAGASARNGSTGNGVPGQAYAESFFPHAESFVNSLPSVYATIAASDYPNVLVDADEVGVILPDDNDSVYTADAPGFPAIYWNAAAAMYAYIFGASALVGLDVLGESQLIGYPSIPFSRGPPINGPWTAPPQYPSVSMLSWGGAFGQQGDGTARYWALKLLGDSFRAGPPGGAFDAAHADALVNTSVSGGGAPMSSPFCADEPNLSVLSMACPQGVISDIIFASYGTPTGSCGTWAVNASCNSNQSVAVVKAACLGKSSCSVPTTTPVFGDPCYDTVKHLVVEAACSVGGGSQTGLPTAVFAQAFVEDAGTGARKVLVVNKAAVAQRVVLAGATGALWTFLDESAGYGPAQTTTLADDAWTLAPFAVGVLRF